MNEGDGVSDAPSPGRRPRPGPAPDPGLAPDSGSAPDAVSAPDSGSVPDPETRPAASPVPASRSARRRAERQAGSQARLRRLRWIMLTALVVAVVAGGASVLVAFSGDDGGSAASRHTTSASSSAPAAAGAALRDPDQVTAFLAAATGDVNAVSTYDYRHLDDALQAGLSVTTGSYRTAFRNALSGDQATAARADQVVHQFDVLDLGIGEMNDAGTQAKVLVFGRQLSTDKTHRVQQATMLTLCATMVREGDRYLISDLEQDADAGRPPGSPALVQALEAGRSEVVNALTYTRTQFDADLRRAQAGAIDPLRQELTAEAKSTQQAMVKGGYDLTGVVVSSAVKSAAGDAAVLMVAAESTRVAPGGSQVTPVRYDVTVNLVHGAWLVSQVQALPSR